jgi:L-asparaginase
MARVSQRRSALTGTYGFPGSERDLISRGLIPTGFLDGFKARVLLHLALAADASPEQITAAFAAAGGLAGEPEWPWPTGSMVTPAVVTGGR